MLQALGHSPATPNHAQPAAAPEKPEVSIYDPPADLPTNPNPGEVSVRNHTLYEKGDLKIYRELVWEPSSPGKHELLGGGLVVKTGERADTIHVRNWSGDKLQLIINGESHLVDKDEAKNPNLELRLETNGGNDKVFIDDDVKIRVTVVAGDGDDFVQAGGGPTKVFGERGNDVIRLGSGLGYAEGEDGDDTIIGGSGHVAIYGGKGNDRLYAGVCTASKQSYLDGGEGKDRLYAGTGHTVLHGGKDDDLLVGFARTTFYTGSGQDTIFRNKADDRIYAGANDRFDRTRGSAFTEVKPSNAGHQGFTVTGDENFKNRMADDFEFFRSSPIGQQTLAGMDDIAKENGAKVEILQVGYGGGAYVFGSTAIERLTPEELEHADNSIYGEIKDGIPGSRADRGKIYIDPHSILENPEQTNTFMPVTILFHEIAHAYNGGTGTSLSGEIIETHADGESWPVLNEEYQVIGLPNDAEPFDFDNDPSTPLTTVNPKPFTENALREEMGKPLRRHYVLENGAQGTPA
ncbi:M91 family zinc metallopeptidase [Pseudomonas sp. SDO5271_S396]